MKKTNAKEISFLSVSSSQGDLWERFQKGDMDALGKIYRNHVDYLYNYGLHFAFQVSIFSSGNKIGTLKIIATKTL